MLAKVQSIETPVVTSTKGINSVFSLLKEGMMMIYLSIMTIITCVIVMELKLQFDLDIPHLDIPLDEMYVTYFK